MLSKDGPKDASLVGKLVEELDQAKKDLSEIRAKSDYLTMTQNLTSKGSWKRSVPKFLLVQGMLSDYLSVLVVTVHRVIVTSNSTSDEALHFYASTIALVSDLFQAKQQVVCTMGEAVLKGKVPDVQKRFLITKRLRSPAEMQKRKPSERMKLTDENAKSTG